MIISGSWLRAFILAFMLAGNLPMTVMAQEVQVRAGFLSDSTRVGDEVLFYLTAKYPKSKQVIFPDTTFSFSPFELTRKDYFPTNTTDTLSYDSAVYQLRTFEIDAEQTLRLPVFLINSRDCTSVFSNSDTVALQYLVNKLPDTLTNLPLKPTTAYQHVAKEINIPLITVITSFAFLLAGIGWVVLGPSINRHFRLKRLRKVHQQFTLDFEMKLKTLRNEFSVADTEVAITGWKKYMEKITRKPYTKLTTSETMELEKNELLGKHLRVIDKAIYGNGDNVIDQLESLKSFADQRFNEVITEIKNG